MESSPRDEECRKHAVYCEEAAAVASDPRVKATFKEAAATWRELANQFQTVLSLELKLALLTILSGAQFYLAGLA
jgi:hypothetical protein